LASLPRRIQPNGRNRPRGGSAAGGAGDGLGRLAGGAGDVSAAVVDARFAGALQGGVVKYRSHQRGFMLADVASAFFVLAVLATALTLAISGQRRAGEKLADRRAAVRLAERAMAELSSGRPADPPGDYAEQ